ncbi:MAG: NAD(P)-dependent dehydrogenase (short-subunit alcohol dehydrogenase family) [Cryomorphaceae bacterium]|jgi:NAD(P)-dependent dehydrogenase (short-subunit alcohol dehydrogenase family)
MKDFKNKTAFVTGAASGIGLALSKELVARGANVMMSDVNVVSLETAAADINAVGQIATVACNVADHDSVVLASEKVIQRFGQVDLLFNNAGVSLAGQSGLIAIEDWRWIVDINLMGVVHGTEVFLPLLRAHQQQAHIVNTASMAGHVASAYMSPYHATKFAVVGYSESLRQELQESNIGVSVLCPTWVKSNIYNAHGGAPSLSESENDFTDSPVYQMSKQLIDNGMSAEDFADLTLNAILKNRFYVFNDPAARVAIDNRREQILTDYDACLAESANLIEVQL